MPFFNLPILDKAVFPGDRMLLLFAKTASSQLDKSDYIMSLFQITRGAFLQKFSKGLSAFHSCDKTNKNKGWGETGSKSTQVPGKDF